MPKVVVLESVPGSKQQAGLHSRRAGSIEFGDDIAQKKNCRRRAADIRGDAGITRGFSFGANGRVVVTRQQRQQVARHGVAEEQLLGVHTAGGVDSQFLPRSPPVLEATRHVIVNMRLQFAGLESRFPHLTLQFLQTGRLQIGIHLPKDFNNESLLGCFRGQIVLADQFPQRLLAAIERNLLRRGEHCRPRRMLREELGQFSADVGEHLVVDKAHRRRGPFNIEQDDTPAKLNHSCLDPEMSYNFTAPPMPTGSR